MKNAKELAQFFYHTIKEKKGYERDQSIDFVIATLETQSTFYKEEYRKELDLLHNVKNV